MKETERNQLSSGLDKIIKRQDEVIGKILAKFSEYFIINIVDHLSLKISNLNTGMSLYVKTEIHTIV